MKVDLTRQDIEILLAATRGEPLAEAPRRKIRRLLLALVVLDDLEQANPRVGRTEHEAALEELITDFIQARSSVIAERSTSIARDYRFMVDHERVRADVLGVEWNDRFVPLHVREAIDIDREV